MKSEGFKYASLLFYFIKGRHSGNISNILLELISGLSNTEKQPPEMFRKKSCS